MPDNIIECVPNFSEGRDQALIADLAAIVTKHRHVKLIDIHTDPDHNRSVFTILGTVEEVEAVAFRLIQKASQRINLERHCGTHPRIGAADVVPFVPLVNVTMQDCVAMARRLAKRVGEALEIPAFVYGQAALLAEHLDLSTIRNGNYEKLKERIGTDTTHTPDFGPSVLGPAGATVIGARDFLLAFNIFLDSDDIRIAKLIAKIIRESSGGLKAVKALGMIVDGKAQVSTNLTNFRETSLRTVFEAIKAEAATMGVAPVRSELVGCLPEAAIEGIEPKSILLRDFSPVKILETHLSEIFQPR